jgi:uncharacterized protein YkwD
MDGPPGDGKDAMMHRALLLGVLCFQADDFQKRVRLDGQRVRVDDKVIYEGPWGKADIAVRDFPSGEGFEAWKHVLLSIDGDEKVRLPLKSLAKPVAWPPVDPEELKPVLKKVTETQNGKKTFVVYITTEKAEFEIYRGAVGETQIERRIDSFLVKLNGQPIYRVSKVARPAARAEDVFELLNQYREKARLPKVRLQPLLSRGCDLHALYLSKNPFKGLSGHDEDPKGAGYTEEGMRAGKRSVISPFAPHETPLEGMDSLMATLYHRVSVLQPPLTEIGIGWAFRKDGIGHLVIDVASLEGKPDAKTWPVLYPAPGQTDVPVEFGLGSRETPNPLPADAETAGYPITIQFPEKVDKVLDLEVSLSEGGKDVPCWLSTPDKPARADWPQPGVVCLIPKEKLKPATTYQVKFQYRSSGAARDWSFTTRK